MLDPSLKAKIYDYNAVYFGYPIEKLMERAGRGLAQRLIKKYGSHQRIGFFCGTGNNGGDGFVAARYLSKNSQPEVYLISSADKIRSQESRKNWQRFKGTKFENITAQDILDHFDIIVECLFGTGITGTIRQPYASVIKKLNHIKAKKIACDTPAPGFKPDHIISMMFPKPPVETPCGVSNRSATNKPSITVIDIGYPKHLAEKIGIGEVKALHQPSSTSHKGQNGKLLIIAGSHQYHGAPLLAAKVASKIVDLVYFSSVPENNQLIQKMKSQLCEFITIDTHKIMNYINKVDAILIGPGLGPFPEGTETFPCLQETVNKILKKHPNKKVILDADALKIVDKKLLNPNCVLTPHGGEFKQLFSIQPTKHNVLKMATKYKCIIVLKGKFDYVSDGQELKINTTGNPGMTKGGTGDVLAGLIAALSCTNHPFLAARAGVFLNGLAADRLSKKVSHYFSASDLINEIPKTIKWCLK